MNEGSFTRADGILDVTEGARWRVAFWRDEGTACKKLVGEGPGQRELAKGGESCHMKENSHMRWPDV